MYLHTINSLHRKLDHNQWHTDGSSCNVPVVYATFTTALIQPSCDVTRCARADANVVWVVITMNLWPYKTDGKQLQHSASSDLLYRHS
jgi:hypothetical protein